MNPASIDLTSIDGTTPVVLPNTSCDSSSTNDLADILSRIDKLEQQQCNHPDANTMNLLVFDGSLDRLLAAFVIATGAAACGMRVSMFFTFWATAALRKKQTGEGRKSYVEKAFGWMLPRGTQSARLSQMHMAGMGRFLMKREMRKKNIADLDQLVETAAELDVEIRVCEMSMRLMGIGRDEMLDYPNLTYCGVATFADLCGAANTTLFI
ncbi:MAG: DsrE/DsrF/DrsH-like family protein [Planctomycetales bacterium]|nr:DsrE/DsrF/DrsH-like family protein [Planctomycetales bacterium]